jgi:hypothetical protein
LWPAAALQTVQISPGPFVRLLLRPPRQVAFLFFPEQNVEC